MNAAPCPNCGAVVVPSTDAECWRCTESFTAEDYWGHLA